jgi:hypothetical protein
MDQRESSPFGLDVRINGPATDASDGPMGAFGTNMVMDPEYTQDQEDGGGNTLAMPKGYTKKADGSIINPNGVNLGKGDWKAFGSGPLRDAYVKANGGSFDDTGFYHPPTTTSPVTGPANSSGGYSSGVDIPDPDYDVNASHDHGHGDPVPNAGPGGIYNPWSEGEGGQANVYGPSQASMTQSTMEAMALANAYFAPQRMELAYQLGDMETDMRRLAVNLGRQVDDPVLQAKLYKEGMKAVRTMDIQQNTLAFQMSEQRRREELQNFQFYDSMAQQEYNLRLQNQQFMQKMELDNAMFGLKKDELDFLRSQATPPTPNTSPVPGTENTPVGAPAPGGTGGGNITTAPKVL